MFSQKYQYDIVEAAISNKNPLKDLSNFEARLDIISEMSKQSGFAKFIEASNRIIRITKDEQSGIIDEKLFAYEEEKTLHNKACAIDEKTLPLKDLSRKLNELVPYIEKYFEKVLVMDENLSVRKNRLSMLSSVRDKFLTLADFSKIVL